jgi:hypothetical protein
MERTNLPGFTNEGTPSEDNPHAWMEGDTLIFDDGTSAWGNMTDEEIDACIARNTRKDKHAT